ncbi:MAG: NAD(P)-dependent oxidoreductase, partial [Gemmatimonadales bacterium]|nr:NAD(P)-dependent oxidoreductase [Gemmatimonadales bacterium]
VLVVNQSGGNADAVAEHTVAMMLALTKNIPQTDRSLRTVRGVARENFKGWNAKGRTVGLVGIGEVGRRVARICGRGLEMRVIACDPYLTADECQTRGATKVDLATLLAESRFLSLHCPLNDETRGMIGSRELSAMQAGSYLITTARGGIVDEAALADALLSGQVGGAAIDVFETEPPKDSPLLSAPNTILTPHLGASTAEAHVAVAVEVASGVLDVLDGRPARSAVNAPIVSAEAAGAIAPFLPLAETLGRFFAQFARSAMKTLTFEVAGTPADNDPAPLTAAMLRGLLQATTEERVNLVNAGLLAKARGITVVERRRPEAGAYAALLTVSGEVGGQRVTVGGTVNAGEERLVRLNDYRLDMEPSAVMLITRHNDRPGMIGRVGRILGDADVNISAMHVARSGPRQDALMILALDEDVPEAALESIRTHEAVADLWLIHLGGDT